MHTIGLVACFVVICIVTDEYVIKHGSELAADSLKGQTGVRDIIHHHTLSLEEYYHLYNIILLTAFVFLPLAFGWNTGNKQAFIKDFFSFMMILIIVRKVCTVPTILPSPSSTERNYFDDWKYRVFGHYDLGIASGHLCFAIGMVLLMFKHRFISNKPLWICLLTSYGFFSAATKAHYTADVIGAFLLTPLVFDFYSNESATRSLLF